MAAVEMTKRPDTMSLTSNTQPTTHLGYEILNLKDNEYVFREGETPRGIYMVKSGTVKVVVNRPLTRGRIHSPEFITKIVGPGEFFGFKALVKNENFNFYAKTLKPTEIHIYPKEAITTIVNGPNVLMRQVMQQVVRDLETFEMNTQLYYLASVQERIAYQLVVLAEKFGVPVEGGTSLNLRLTRNELAQLAGTINESLSRHLTEFKNEGLLDLNGREIIIKDKEALKKKSGNFT